MKRFGMVLYLLYVCGMQQPNKQSFDVTGLLTTFPACFSMQAALHFMDSRHSLRCRVTCCISYNQQIDFIVKGPLGIAIIHGRIDEKGITVVDRSHRVVHQWDYKCIKQQYHFPCNYLLIQSLLLGMGPIEHGEPDALYAYLAYTYDKLMHKVIAVQLIDTDNYLLYRYKMAADSMHLSGIKIHFSLRDKLYKGRVTLYNLHFKKLKRPNITLTIPKTVYVPFSPHLHG